MDYNKFDINFIPDKPLEIDFEDVENIIIITATLIFMLLLLLPLLTMCNRSDNIRRLVPFLLLSLTYKNFLISK